MAARMESWLLSEDHWILVVALTDDDVVIDDAGGGGGGGDDQLGSIDSLHFHQAHAIALDVYLKFKPN